MCRPMARGSPSRGSAKTGTPSSIVFTPSERRTAVARSTSQGTGLTSEVLAGWNAAELLRYQGGSQPDGIGGAVLDGSRRRQPRSGHPLGLRVRRPRMVSRWTLDRVPEAVRPAVSRASGWLGSPQGSAGSPSGHGRVEPFVVSGWDMDRVQPSGTDTPGSSQRHRPSEGNRCASRFRGNVRTGWQQRTRCSPGGQSSRPRSRRVSPRSEPQSLRHVAIEALDCAVPAVRPPDSQAGTPLFVTCSNRPRSSKWVASRVRSCSLETGALRLRPIGDLRDPARHAGCGDHGAVGSARRRCSRTSIYHASLWRGQAADATKCTR